MLSLDLSASVADQRSSAALTPCNSMMVERVDSASLANHWQQCAAEKLVWVLQGSLALDYGPESSKQVSAGMYAVLEASQCYRLQGSEDIQLIIIGEANTKATEVAEPKHMQKEPRTGYLINDLSFVSLVVNDHLIQLVRSTVMATEEACLDSDKAIFIVEGALTVADEQSEETLNNNEMVCIKAHTYHRLYADAHTTAITIQHNNARVNYQEDLVAGLN